MYIKVKVTPKAKKEEILKKGADSYEISVREPAEQNKANTRVRELLGHRFSVVVGKIKLVSGHKTTAKIFSVSLE